MMPNSAIYSRYTGNSKGDKISVFLEAGVYRFVYQTYIRTNPSQHERQKGFKPQRIIKSEQIYEFKSLENIDYTLYPFSHLMHDFLPEKSH